MKTTMVTAEILLTEWKGASGTDAYRLFHKKSRQTVAKMTAVFYEGMLYWTDHVIGRLYTGQSVAFTDEQPWIWNFRRIRRNAYGFPRKKIMAGCHKMAAVFYVGDAVFNQSCRAHGL